MVYAYYKNIFIYVIFFSALITLNACDEGLFQKQKLHITFEDSKNNTLIKKAGKRVIYYAGENNTILQKRVDINSKSIQLEVFKNNNSAILSCVFFDFIDSHAHSKLNVLEEGSAFCPFERGSVYPYKAKKVYTLHLRSGNTAQLAKAFLIFHKHGGNTNLLNAYKLETAFDKHDSPFFLDTARFLSDISNNKLSTYSIKPRPWVEFDLASITQESLQNFRSASEVDFLLQNKVSMPTGLWLFINNTTQQYYQIAVTQELVFVM